MENDNNSPYNRDAYTVHYLDSKNCTTCSLFKITFTLTRCQNLGEMRIINSNLQTQILNPHDTNATVGRFNESHNNKPKPLFHYPLVDCRNFCDL